MVKITVLLWELTQNLNEQSGHGCISLFEAVYCVSPVGKYPAGCAAFCLVLPNVELEESGIKEDKEQSEEQTYTEVRM